MVILSALQSIASIVIMISLGFYLTHKGWFDNSTSKLFAKLVTTVSLPCYMLSNLLTSFTKDKLLSSGYGLIIPFFSMIICYMIAKALGHVIMVPRSRRGVFETMFFISNTIFVGLPINLALFGDASLPYVLLYYISNTLIFWTFGIYEIGRDGNTSSGNTLSIETLKRIFSPPLLGFIAAVILILFEIKLPIFIMDTCKYLGNLTTPLSMLFIGIIIYSINYNTIKFTPDMLVIILGRFIISPIMVFVMSKFLPIPSLMRNVFIIQAAMPVMTQTAIISKAYNSDFEYAAEMILITTLLSILFIPIYMLIFTYI